MQTGPLGGGCDAVARDVTVRMSPVVGPVHCVNMQKAAHFDMAQPEDCALVAARARPFCLPKGLAWRVYQRPEAQTSPSQTMHDSFSCVGIGGRLLAGQRRTRFGDAHVKGFVGEGTFGAVEQSAEALGKLAGARGGGGGGSG